MAITSPCINVCVTDPDSDLCYGCARTTPEISKWSKFTDEEQKQIIDQHQDFNFIKIEVVKVKLLIQIKVVVFHHF